MAASSLSTVNTPTWWRSWVSVQILTGMIGFGYTSLQSASIPELWAIEAFHRHQNSAQNWISSGFELNPMKQTYYPIPSHLIRECKSPGELQSCLDHGMETHVIVSFKRNDPGTIAYLDTLSRNQCKRLESTHPDWIFRLERYFPALGRLKYKAVYRCPRPTTKDSQTR